jgi:colanic acid biosynthesis protein WcaH
MIDQQDFLFIIDHTPLVSIDLIIENTQGKILLGRRTNQPAQGFWFVPGGRIRKNETLAVAMQRISSTELGTAFNLSDTLLMGPYDHIYANNFAGVDSINTHYVALGYQLNIDDRFKIQADTQHSEMKWWNKEDLLVSKEVHQNTKAYFQN